MRMKSVLSLSVILFLSGSGGFAGISAGSSSDVDPFIGTDGVGHTHPAASCPFGMIQAGPDTGTGEWKYCSGYQHGDKSILGYSQTRLSGTGCPAGGDVQVLPFSGRLRSLPMRSAIDKGSERAEPGYYVVDQTDDGVQVEIAAASKAAIYRMTWKDGSHAKVLVNLPFGFGNAGLPGKAEPEVSCSESRRIEGCYWRIGWVPHRRVSFSLAFDRPWTSLEALSRQCAGEAPRYVLSFVLKEGDELRMKVALSTVDATHARANLESEIPDWDFDSVRARSRKAWNDLLSRFEVEADDSVRRCFYTALYHLCLQPNDLSDFGAEPRYSTFSCWDTYRAAHPLYTLFTPERVEPFVRSLLRQAETTGHLPVWALWGHDNQCMIGTHSVPIVVDACLKGFRGFDLEAAYRAVRGTLTETHGGRVKENWDLYDRYGYYPCDLLPDETVSRTLECAYDDACAARFAKLLGKDADAEFFLRRSRRWRNVFDPKIRFFRGKDSKGRWNEPFEEFRLRKDERHFYDYTEGNAWHYRWHVQQDPEGLVDAFGGKDGFAAELDRLFRLPSDAITGPAQLDVTGMIGQYAHGNEPCHHVPYLFQYADRGDIGCERIGEIFHKLYSDRPDGLCGNDDCGQLSAWYVFAAMGFYPVDPCGGDYVIGAPQVPKATLNLANGKTFTMTAKNLSKENKYVKSVMLNGEPITDWKIRHKDIVKGGELVFEMMAK